MPFGALERPVAGAGPPPGPAPARRASRATPATSAFAFAERDRRRRVPVGLARAAVHRVRRRLALHRGALRAAARARRRLRRRRSCARQWRLDDAAIAPAAARCARTVRAVPRALPGRRCRGSDYDVVGFTSTFEQNIASLALARRVKARAPEHRRSSSAAPTGRGRWARAAPPLRLRRRRLLRARPTTRFPRWSQRSTTAGQPGRSAASSTASDGAHAWRTAPAALVRDLDALPMPDYDPWFARPRTRARPRPMPADDAARDRRAAAGGARSRTARSAV